MKGWRRDQSLLFDDSRVKGLLDPKARTDLLWGSGWAATKFARCWASAAWVRSIARATRSWIETWRSSSCPGVHADPERLARFEREARVLASLNHPHIGAIYGVEDADGTPALVLELVEGETLADRARGPVPVSEALRIAADRGRARSGARERHRPPRSQAGQHQAHAGRRRESPRLRAGEGGLQRPSAGRPDALPTGRSTHREGLILGTPSGT